MANGRMINVNIWQSENVATLSLRHRLLWIGLITTADDQGRGRAHPGIIRATVFPLEDIALGEIADGLQAFAKVGMIQLYNADGKDLYQILNWWEYQGAMRWAWPSKYPAPDSWQDRTHYRRGNTVFQNNWTALCENGDDSDSNLPSNQSEVTVEPSRSRDDTTAEPAPNDNDNPNDNPNDKSNENTTDPDNAAIAAPVSSTPVFAQSEPKKANSGYTALQRHLLAMFGAKRLNSVQSETINALEVAYNYEQVIEAAKWAAKKGMRLGDALCAIEKALPKWGKGNGGKRGTDQRDRKPNEPVELCQAI